MGLHRPLRCRNPLRNLITQTWAVNIDLQDEANRSGHIKNRKNARITFRERDMEDQYPLKFHAKNIDKGTFAVDILETN